MEKRIITEQEIESLARDGVVEVVRGMIVTPLAREYASRKGIRLVYGGGTVPGPEDIPRDPESGRKGPPESRLVEEVAEEVVRALTEAPGPAADVIPPYSPLADDQAARAIEEAEDHGESRAVVVATGINKPGVAAALTSTISQCGADIQDINQNIVSDFFTMIFVVALDPQGMSASFKDFKERVESAAAAAGVEAVVFHEAILRAMHRV